MQFAHSTLFPTPKKLPGTHINSNNNNNKAKYDCKKFNKFIVETIKNINIKAINATLRMLYNVVYLIVLMIINDHKTESHFK